MASTYGRLKSIWCGVLPKKARHALYEMCPRKDIYHSFIAKLQAGASHEEIYDKDYYDHLVDPPMQCSAPVMVASIQSEFNPSTVIDVGCGTGVLLGECVKMGWKAIGLEYADAGLEICHKRGIDARKFDIESEVPSGLTADVVISTEVAEHLHEKYADRFVDLLCSISDNVILTAAAPGSTGDDHVNEQPNEYWIQKMEDRNYHYEKALAEQWRVEWPKDGVHGIYYSTIMVFRRKA